MLWSVFLIVPTSKKYLFPRTRFLLAGYQELSRVTNKQLCQRQRRGGKRSDNNERFMRLMIESGKTFLDGILFNAFNAVYSQFSLFPFCLSVFDCSHEISQCTSKIIRGTECVNKGHGVNGFIDEQINNALIKQLTRWWK